MTKEPLDLLILTPLFSFSDNLLLDVYVIFFQYNADNFE